MIIQNGTIQISASGKSHVDPDKGYPVKMDNIYGETLPCQYIPTQKNMIKSVDGNRHTVAGYTILIEDDIFCDSGELGVIKLRRKDGTEIGVFPIIDIEHLEAVSEIKITV